MFQLMQSQTQVATWTMREDERPRHYLVPADMQLRAYRPGAFGTAGDASVTTVVEITNG